MAKVSSRLAIPRAVAKVGDEVTILYEAIAPPIPGVYLRSMGSRPKGRVYPLTAFTGCALFGQMAEGIKMPMAISRYDIADLDGPFGPPFGEAMNFPEVATQCVLFLGNKEVSTACKVLFRPRATAFIVSIYENNFYFSYVVTAEHNIAGFAEKRWDIWVRSNLKGGGVREEKWESPKWWFHPDESVVTDVAVAPIVIGDDEELQFIPLNGPNGIAGSSEVLTSFHIGVGDEVAITGLFKSHAGKQSNIPIVRIGNLSLMRGEPVYTSYRNGMIDAYLIEARSISGLSGSPVFVNMPPWMTDNDGGIIATEGSRVYLLGLMHGHFDVKNITEDIVVEDGSVTSGINTGIGIVIPVEKIIETIYQPELVEMRKEAAKGHGQEFGATPDFGEIGPAPLSDDANPNHLEDFTRLVDVAARKRPQGDQT